MAHELHRIAHSRAGGAHSVGVAGTVEDDAVTELILERLDACTLFYAYAAGIDFAVVRHIEQTFVLAAVHILDQYQVVPAFFRFRGLGCGPHPFAVTLDVEVISPVGDRHSGDRAVLPAPFGLDADYGGVGLEEHCKAGRTADLTILSRGETLVEHGVHTVIRVRGVVHNLSDEIEFGSLGESELYVLRCLGGRCQAEQSCGKNADDSFHCSYYVMVLSVFGTVNIAFNCLYLPADGHLFQIQDKQGLGREGSARGG